MRKRKFWKVAILLVSLIAVLTVSTVIACAYYMSRVYLYTDDDGDRQLFRAGMELNTFFDKINSGTTEPTSTVPAVADKTPLGIACTNISVVKQTNGSDDFTESTVGGVTYFTNNTSHLTVKATTTGTATAYEYVYNASCAWGDASNPYLISRINHLQNLYVLQNAGFFDTYYMSQGVQIGKTEADMPYFLVCTSIGTPVTIDGTDKVFEFIGNDAHPFIGFLGGAFVTKDSGSVTLSTVANGQTSVQSTIYNLTVESKDDVVDVGLFGRIGYLGTLPSSSETKTFEGAVSTVRDLLLYDVKVRVTDKSVWNAIVEKTAHLFSFSSSADDVAALMPHENHHVGILAGHVELSTVEYVSVYYSNDQIAAIDVDMPTKSSAGVSANFYSVSGILGYVVNMNSVQLDGVITIGGVDNTDIVVSGGGSGSGGGLASGEGRGYVTAAEIYNVYNASGKIVKVTTGSDASQASYYGLLIEISETGTQYTDEDGDTKTTYLTLPDGTPVKYKANNDVSQILTFAYSTNFFGTTSVSTEPWTNFVVHDLTKSAGAPNEYFYFPDGTLESVVYVPATAVTDAAISMKFAAKLQADAGSTSFVRLCTQYERERIGSSLTGLTQLTDRFYFYDGVFTFALAQATDTISSTWLDETPDKIVVGADDDASWTQDESALPNSVVAFMKPITSEADLRAAETADKEIFIAYKEGNSYHIVTLAANSAYNAGEGDNAVTTPQTTLSLVSDDLRASIAASLNNNTLTLDGTSASSLDDLKANWSSIQILDLGTKGNTGLSLDELRSRYQVKVTKIQQTATNDTFEDDGHTVATEALKNNARATATIAGNYYALSSVSEIGAPQDESGNPSTEFGENFTLFTLQNTATVNLAKVGTAINDKNNTFYLPSSFDTVQTTTPYYLRLKSGASPIDYAATFTALNALSSKYYTLSSFTSSTSNSISYLTLKTSSTEVSLSTAQSAINTLNGTYYTYDSANAVSGSPSRFSLKSSVTAVDTSAVQSAIATYNSNYYKDDASTVLDATLKANLPNGSGITLTKNRTFTEFYYFNTRRSGIMYYEFYKVSGGSVSSRLKYETTTLIAADAGSAVSSLLGGSLGSSSVPKIDGLYYCTYNGVTLPVLYELDGSYYSTWNRNTGNRYVYDGGTNANVSNYQFTSSYSQTFNYIIESRTGNGTVYTWNGLSTSCSNVQSQGNTVANVAEWNDKTIYGVNYNLYSSNQGSNAIKIVRYVVDGLLVQEQKGSGVAYSLLKPDGTSESISGPFTSSGSSLTVGSTSYATYQSGGSNKKLGVPVVKLSLDSFLLQTSTGGGITYTAINSSGTQVATVTSTFTDTGNTIKIGSVSHKIYMSGGRLGIALGKFSFNGVIATTSTGEGITYPVLDSSKTQIGTANATMINTQNSVKVGNVTLPLYISGGYFGVNLARIYIDGVMLQSQTGTGVTYSLVNGSGSVLSGTVGPNFTDTGNQLTADGKTYAVYLSGGKFGVRLANFKTDGYFMANISSSGTVYKLNNQTVVSEPKPLNGTIPLSNGTTTKNYKLYVSDGKLGIMLIYEDYDQEYFYKFWHATNAYVSNPFGDPDPFVLQILYRDYTIGTDRSGMIVSTNAYVENESNFDYPLGLITIDCQETYHSSNGIVTFENGVAYLQYSVNGTTRYLSYSTSGGYFNSASSKGDATKMYLFTVEGTHDSSTGNHIVPIAGTEIGTYAADQYVLWPNNTYLSTDTATSAYNPSQGYMQDTSYTIRSLAELAASNWINNSGSKIGMSDLSKVFSLGDGISDVNMMNLWGGNTGTIAGANNYVKAPVGTTGEEAYIPTGCVAFRINSSKVENKIRVIVAVPVSEFYYGQVGSGGAVLNPGENAVDYSKDYCFCMWKVDEANASDSYSFSVSNCQAAFELPRSAPYDSVNTAGSYYSAISGNDYSVTGTDNVKKYINVTMNGNTYRAYLNGEEVLVAYEFTADEEGIYLLGSTQKSNIVYFSADSTSSAGKDGVISYKTGTVDFVYDNGSSTVNADGTVNGTAGSKILTVRDTNPSSEGISDYSLFYYSSLALLFTDNSCQVNPIQAGDTDVTNGYPNLNNFAVYIRRVATQNAETGGYATFAWQTKSHVTGSASVTYDAAYIQISRYAVDSDPVVRRTYGTIPRADTPE